MLSGQKHGAGKDCAVFRKTETYCRYGLGDFEDGVDAKVKAEITDNAFKLLVNFIGHKAQAYVRLYAPLGKVEDRPGLNRAFGNAECPLDYP